MLYEIRNYHYRPDKFDAYRRWAIDLAAPFLTTHLDVIDFWLGTQDPPEMSGTDPMPLAHGSANVTWIIRWADMAARTEGQAIYQSDGWRAIWAQHPDPGGYLQLEARFAESATGR